MEHPTQNPTDKQDGKDANRPLHHFLVAAMVLFVANEAAVSVPVNAVILTEDRDLKVAEIAKSLLDQFGDPERHRLPQRECCADDPARHAQ